MKILVMFSIFPAFVGCKSDTAEVSARLMDVCRAVREVGGVQRLI